MWLSTFESGEVQLRSSQKSRRNHRSCVWTEALSVMVFVPAQIKAIRYSMNTYPICDWLHFRDRPGAALLRYRNRDELTFLICERTEALFDMVFVPAWIKAIHYSMNTYPISDSLPSRLVRHNFAALQKSSRTHRSYVWTEALSVNIALKSDTRCSLWRKLEN